MYVTAVLNRVFPPEPTALARAALVLPSLESLAPTAVAALDRS